MLFGSLGGKGYVMYAHTLSENPWCWKQDESTMLVLFCLKISHEFPQHMQIRQNQENYQTHRIRVNAGFALAKKAPPVWTRCKTSRRWVDQELSPSHTASHVAQTSWRHGRPRSRPTCNRSPERESSATHNKERTGWKSLVSSHRNVEPWVSPSKKRSTQSVMPAQPAWGECRRKH